MGDTQTETSPLVAVLWPQAQQRIWLRRLALCIGGAAALTISAKIQIPFWPVPMTLQTMVVAVLGLSYGLGLASATVLAYLAIGAAGAPVFAAGGGLAYFTGPTGGYLLGFALAATVMGYLGDRGWGKNFLSMAAAMAVGTALIFICGVVWLSVHIGPTKALAAGLYPFIASELLKMLVAAISMPQIWRLVERKPDK